MPKFSLIMRAFFRLTGADGEVIWEAGAARTQRAQVSLVAVWVGSTRVSVFFQRRSTGLSDRADEVGTNLIPHFPDLVTTAFDYGVMIAKVQLIEHGVVGGLVREQPIISPDEEP